MRLGMALAAALLLAAGTARAQGRDQRFLDQAFSTSWSEIQLGRLAIKRGTSDEVRDYGRRMVDDHQLALDQLRRVARKSGFLLPNQVSPADQVAIARLSHLYGPAFDEAYLEHVRDAHAQALQVFREEVQYGQDPRLQRYARRQLPVLDANEQLARDELAFYRGRRLGRGFPRDFGSYRGPGGREHPYPNPGMANPGTQPFPDFQQPGRPSPIR